MDKFLAIAILAILSLIGCAPGGELTVTEPPEKTEPAGTGPALRGVDENSLDGTDLQGAGGETMPGEPDPEQTGQADEPARTDQAATAVAPSGVIDLSDISQDQEAGGGELIELPAPGVPNTSTVPVEIAKNDLASRLDINVAGITLVAVEPVVWPDSSLGCPDPDKDYSMALVDGFRISLEGDGQSYIYHTDMSGQAILCEGGQPAGP